MIAFAMKSPIYENIQRALDAPSGKLLYLKAGELYKKEDFFEIEGNVLVVRNKVTSKVHIHAGHTVTTYAVENFKPRRYINNFVLDLEAKI